MAAEPLRLVEKGSLGTCWYGRYHTVEPWAGCGHGCQYCYARWRGPVTEKLRELGTAYENPVPLLPAAELPGRIVAEVKKQGVSIVKLCRYTDIMNPAFVQNGLAWEILDALAGSSVQRIIVTTKGLPDDRLLALMRDHKAKFSYNAAARPAADFALEPHLPPLGDRLAAAAVLRRGGVQTTIHLDPLVAGVDDEAVKLRPFLDDLRRRGLLRVMFSYLLLSDPILERLREKLPSRLLDRITAAYDLTKLDRYLPRDAETAYYSTRPELKRASVSRVAGALRELGFEFVLCSLKSAPGPERGHYRDAKPCDGTFYA
jgi:DNA repair photolyase